MTKVFPLKAVVQHYAWGGYQFIPQLLQLPSPSSQPHAEIWMGTHTKGTASLTYEGKNQPLSDLLAAHPEMLGESTRSKFGNRLPYLFKVLDVRQMLSIQAHPNKQQAEEGFARENKAGAPLHASNRNYRDDNHKPEIMVALTDFWLLHGFKAPAEILHLLQSIPEFKELAPVLEQGDIFTLYREIMTMPQERVDQILRPLGERLNQALLNNKLTKDQPDYWAAKAFSEMASNGHCDRGIFSIYLFNLVHIPPGEGIFQGAGIPHAYLEGQNMELMANSDNVFRGGLTVKHIDVPELLKSLNYDPVTPNILKGEPRSATEVVYPAPVPDFELSKITLTAANKHQTTAESPEILIVMEGELTVNGDQHFQKGNIFFVPAGNSYTLESGADCLLFKASVP